MTLYTGNIATNHHRGTRIAIVRDYPFRDYSGIDEWWMELSPPQIMLDQARLQGWPQERLEREFRRYLRGNPVRYVVENLARYALTEDISLLCEGEDPPISHRRIVAEECRRKIPTLPVEIY